VLGNSVLRRIFGPKRDEVTGEWRRLDLRSSGILRGGSLKSRRLHNEELYYL
jgi:hypothetical protein